MTPIDVLPVLPAYAKYAAGIPGLRLRTLAAGDADYMAGVDRMRYRGPVVRRHLDWGFPTTRPCPVCDGDGRIVVDLS